MSVAEILEELPRLTLEERVQIAERLATLDDLSDAQWEIVEQRVRQHDAEPGSAIPLDDFKANIKVQYRL